MIEKAITESVISPSTSPVSLRMQLKAQTAELHHKLENVLAIMDSELSPSRLQQILEGFLQIYQPFEAKLAERALEHCPAAKFYFDGRQKLRLLQNDLHLISGKQLHVDSAVDFSWLKSSELCWGAMYVVEGSTLGGQLIQAHLIKLNLVNRCNDGSHFFQGYGKETGLRWQTFLAKLQEVPSDQHSDVVQGALLMFETMHSFFERMFACRHLRNG